MNAKGKIQEIYIGLLGRAADEEGLNYWTGEYESGNLTLDQIRSNLVNSQAEYASGLGSMSRGDAVTELYQRLFHREPESTGLDYWVNGGGSTVPFDQLVLALADGAGDEDRGTLDNKIDIADYYTHNYIYTSSDAELVLTLVSTDQSLEELKYVNEYPAQGVFNMSSTNFNAAPGSFNSFVHFSYQPGRLGTPNSETFHTLDTLQGYGQAFSVGDASIVTNDTAASGVAAIDFSGLATFSASDTTLDQHIIAVEQAITNAADPAQGQAAMWQEGDDAFIFFSDGVDGLTENDTLVKLVGVDTSQNHTDYLIDIGTSFALG